MLIRRLELPEPCAGNISVVEDFRISRYRYSVSPAGFILMFLVPASDLLRPILVVMDPYQLNVEHGINHRFDVIFADNALQHTLRFFQIHRNNTYKRKQKNASAV